MKTQSTLIRRSAGGLQAHIGAPPAVSRRGDRSSCRDPGCGRRCRWRARARAPSDRRSARRPSSTASRDRSLRRRRSAMSATARRHARTARRPRGRAPRQIAKVVSSGATMPILRRSPPRGWQMVRRPSTPIALWLLRHIRSRGRAGAGAEAPDQVQDEVLGPRRGESGPRSGRASASACAGAGLRRHHMPLSDEPMRRAEGAEPPFVQVWAVAADTVAPAARCELRSMTARCRCPSWPRSRGAPRLLRQLLEAGQGARRERSSRPCAPGLVDTAWSGVAKASSGLGSERRGS